MSHSNPNILLVFSDQESAHHGWRGLHTPNQVRLAYEGTTFTQAYCVTPQCSPARAALLTGHYPHTTGVEANLGVPGIPPLSTSWPTIATHLRRAGYDCGYFGKWHLGNDDRLSAFGFEGRVGFGEGLADSTVTKCALDWMGSRRSPWFLVVSYVNPHDVYFPNRYPEVPVRGDIDLPASRHDSLEGKPAPQRRFLLEDDGKRQAGADDAGWRRYLSFYYHLIERVDAELGRLLAAVDREPDGPDTCVFYTSDHGDMHGGHGLPFKGPFMYEEQLNIPLIVRWPDKAHAGSVSDKLVSHLDVLPTMLELAGAAVPHGLPGASLAGLFDGRACVWRREQFHEYLAKQNWFNPIRTVRAGQFKLNHYLWSDPELYDLSADPHEMRNLAPDALHADTMKSLMARLESWRRQTGDAGRWNSPRVRP